MSDSLWPHGLQQARLLCPSPTPRAWSNSCPLSQWCHPTISSSSSPFPPAFNLPQHQSLFQGVSSSHQVDSVLAFQLQHQSSWWIFRTESFRMDWLDLLAVQGTLKSLLQHHSSKASILWHSALSFFFEIFKLIYLNWRLITLQIMARLSHPYVIFPWHQQATESTESIFAGTCSSPLLGAGLEQS